MIYRGATYFTDSQMMEYYQKTEIACLWKVKTIKITPDTLC